MVDVTVIEDSENGNRTKFFGDVVNFVANKLDVRPATVQVHINPIDNKNLNF